MVKQKGRTAHVPQATTRLAQIPYRGGAPRSPGWQLCKWLMLRGHLNGEQRSPRSADSWGQGTFPLPQARGNRESKAER